MSMRPAFPTVVATTVAAVLLCVASLVAVGPVADAAPRTPQPWSHDADRSVAHTISIGGMNRDFRLYRPSSATGQVPLVVMLHGGYGSAKQAEDSYGWDAAADQGRFAVAFPDGVWRSWNAGTCCGPAQKKHIDDVGFITAMIAAIERQMPIDRGRVFVTGMSNGAMMALRLACETTVFAAAAPVAGTQLVDCRNARPMSVLQIHGTADPRVPYNGGPGQGFSLRGARVDGPSIPSVNAFWRTTDHCRPPTTTTRTPVTTSTARCPDGKAVQLISIAGAGHQWPGSAAHPVLERTLGTDPPSTALHATQVIWQFFATR